MSTVPVPGTILTGNSVSSNIVRYSFLAPDDFWINACINALLVTLTNPSRWTQGGSVTTDQAAEVFTQIIWSLVVSQDVGSIILFAGIALPAYCLPCDGASYLRTDYPNLFAVIGVTWGSVDTTHFNVPDMRGRTPIDSGTGSGLSPRTLADTGGEETHTLTVAEMPSHNHAQAQTILTSTVVPPPLDGLSPNPLSNFTGNTGGDGAHNNMQPFAVLNFGIIFQ